MAVQLNHTLVNVRDKKESATFVAEVLGLAAPTPYGPFLVVQVENDVSLDFIDVEALHAQHYAFLVSEAEFDEILGRIRERGLTFWADPFQQAAGEWNTDDGGRGLYWRGAERPPARDHHPALRQRRLTRQLWTRHPDVPHHRNVPHAEAPMDAEPAHTDTADPGHSDTADPGLESLRLHRAELLESMGALELALAAPAGNRSAAWAERVHVALVELTGDFRQHIALTEGPGGLYSGLLTAAPRLSNSVAKLTQDHGQVNELAEDLLARMAEPEAVHDSDDVDGLRVLATTLLARLSRHRQRGADLVYEAYQTDIGGET